MGKTSLSYILTHRYYDEYKKILEKANVTVLPDSAQNDKGGSSTSDILGVVAMMRNGGVQTNPVSSSHKSTSEGQNQASSTTGIYSK